PIERLLSSMQDLRKKLKDLQKRFDNFESLAKLLVSPEINRKRPLEHDNENDNSV
ncbi:hypothetical protein BX616_008103, partial [Lobosporangium transversale]